MMLSEIKYKFLKDGKLDLNDKQWANLIGRACKGLQLSARADAAAEVFRIADIKDPTSMAEYAKSLTQEDIVKFICHSRNYDALEISLIVSMYRKHEEAGVWA